MKNHLVDDTICAISTPIGEGGIGIIRISGPKALPIARKLFVPSGSRHDIESHRLSHGWMRDPATNSTLDEVLLSFMAAPRTYTREDVVEINCHSGFAVLNKLLELVIREGARLAEPGEFTRRAFLNGRIDLSQAEAVIDVIRSRAEKSLACASRQLRGDLRRRLEGLHTSVLQLQSQIEAHIDFSDDLPEEADDTDLMASILESELIGPLSQLVAQHESGRLVREGLTLVLVGKPNVGKSSLLNALLGEDRAIVTPQPGTTRDVIADTFVLSGVLVKILDTAGIRSQPDEIESKGIEKTLQSVEDADAVLWLIDRSRPLSDEDDAVYKAIASTQHVILMNKSDLPPCATARSVEMRYGSKAPTIPLSVLNDEDVVRLRGILVETFLQKPLENARSMIIPNLRHKACLERSLEDLKRARHLLLSGHYGELVSLELQAARLQLEAVLGITYDDALLDTIFSQFCVGK